ncbi:unnamed protein product [Rotaria sp. Silwood1]|nr:unnamed protein product [Rotaria sp. Silwood1]
MIPFSGFVSSIKSAYNNINPTTLTGAIDVIVVKQEDGTLRCTPFHVCFGKLSVLTNQQNKVYITINGSPIEDICMILGEAGEALFIEDENTTQCVSSNHHIEPSDSKKFLESNTAVLNDSNSPLSNIDCSPQIINKQLDEEKSYENNEAIAKYVYEQTASDVDELNSNISISTCLHQKPPVIDHNEQNDKYLNGDENQEVEKILPSNEYQSRRRQRTSSSISMDDNMTDHRNDEQRNASTTHARRLSVNEHDLLQFQIDDEKQSSSSRTFVNEHSQKNLLIIPPKTSDELDNSEDYRSCFEESVNENENDRRTTRILSDPILIEQNSTKKHTLTTTDESNLLINTFLSQSAPITINENNVSIQMNQPNDSTSFYLIENFSPTSSFENSITPEPTSPKSDTEYELNNSSQQSVTDNQTSSGWLWGWGEFPEKTRNMLKSLWTTSSKKNTSQQEIHPDNIINDKCDDRSYSSPQINIQQSKPRSLNDTNPELGADNVILQSPVQEYQTSCLLDDVQLSLCGNVDKLSSITDDLFNQHLISYEKFANNPSIINDPNLVVRMGGKFHNWNVALALMISFIVYRKQLPSEIVEKLPKKHTAQILSRTISGMSLWPFSRKTANVKNENTPSSSADTLTSVDKFEFVSTIQQNQNSIQKDFNDGETKDHEVKTIIDNIENAQSNRIHNSKLKKTMILTSDQLKLLNLKDGINKVEFSVTTSLQGTTVVEANIFVFDHKTKFVISDIDGTITISDILGHIFPLFGRDWSHDGIAQFFQSIQENNYQFIYLSARAIGQSRITRRFLRNITQCGFALPIGPLLISPDRLMTAFYREVIARRSEDFKIACLKNIASLFPNKNPFYAGFGNRKNDLLAYTTVGIPETRIFTINPRGEIVREKISQVLSTSYKNLHEVVDQLFPPIDSFSASEYFSSFTFWRERPTIDPLEDEMRKHLEEMNVRKKFKGKGST